MEIDCASEKKTPCNTSHLCLDVFLVGQNHLETAAARVGCWSWMGAGAALSCPQRKHRNSFMLP